MPALAEVTTADWITLSGLPTPFTLRLPEPLSDEELIEFSRNVEPYKVERNENGELEIMSPSTPKGATREAYAIRMLGNWADENGGESFSSQGGFTLSDTSVRMADAAWISEERWNALTAAEQESLTRICPEFLIEIRSKNDSRPKVEEKMQKWMNAGARLAWMIDPFQAEVQVYRPNASVEVLTRPDWVEADSVVTGFRLETARMWAE